MNPWVDINAGISASVTGKEVLSDFYLFEPWNVGPRPSWFQQEVKGDQVKWDDALTQQIYGEAPHPFQSGILFSDALIVMGLAATQVGKSLPLLVDVIITLTGELPISLRYPEDQSTDVKRKMSVDNIRRWGRFDAKTGALIDHDEMAIIDPSWDCGCVVGAGGYPKSHLCDKDSDQVWIGTFKEAKDVMWLPTLKEYIPKHMLNTRRYDDGFEAQKGIFHFNSGRTLHIITYEQGHQRFEAKMAKMIVLDEEPPDRRIFAAALAHCERLRIPMTPYNGITWMYHDVLKSSKSSEIAVFHATAYDSPYKTRENVNDKKRHMRKYELAARVYGLFASSADKPFFDQDMLMPMASRYFNVGEKLRLRYAIPEKFNAVQPDPKMIDFELADEVDMRDVLEVWERPKPDVAYWVSADTAAGGETAAAAADKNIAYVFRPPRPGEPEWPVVVAVLYSTLPVREFAVECMKMAAWYNVAMLAPESRGETAAYFVAESRDWPLYFHMNVMRDADNRETDRLGFVTSPTSRNVLCTLLTDYLRDHFERKTVQPFTHQQLLKEYQTAVTDEKGRMDHPETSSTDCLIGFAIGLYVWKYGREQIRLVQSQTSCYNEGREQGISPALRKRMVNVREFRPVLGGRGMDARERGHGACITLREGWHG